MSSLCDTLVWAIRTGTPLRRQLRTNKGYSTPSALRNRDSHNLFEKCHNSSFKVIGLYIRKYNNQNVMGLRLPRRGISVGWYWKLGESKESNQQGIYQGRGTKLV